MEDDKRKDAFGHELTTSTTTTKRTMPLDSEFLLTLLRQALTSNDDAQIETALQVTDRTSVRNSVTALCQ